MARNSVINEARDCDLLGMLSSRRVFACRLKMRRIPPLLSRIFYPLEKRTLPIGSSSSNIKHIQSLRLESCRLDVQLILDPLGSWCRRQVCPSCSSSRRSPETISGRRYRARSVLRLPSIGVLGTVGRRGEAKIQFGEEDTIQLGITILFPSIAYHKKHNKKITICHQTTETEAARIMARNPTLCWIV